MKRSRGGPLAGGQSKMARRREAPWLQRRRRNRATVDYLYGYDATARVIADHQYALVTDAYLNDADTREFLQRHNPHAMHSICERLLEAMQRGLWQAPGDYRAQVEQHLLTSEQQIEGMQT
jgi:Cobalamin biosynthesis protein CobN and related Mg-chelatases